jgi:hypothetical protein
MVFLSFAVLKRPLRFSRTLEGMQEAQAAIAFYQDHFRKLGERRRVLKTARGKLEVVAGTSPRLAQHLQKLFTAIAMEKREANWLLSVIAFFETALRLGSRERQFKTIALGTKPAARRIRRKPLLLLFLHI